MTKKKATALSSGPNPPTPIAADSPTVTATSRSTLGVLTPEQTHRLAEALRLIDMVAYAHGLRFLYQPQTADADEPARSLVEVRRHPQRDDDEQCLIALDVHMMMFPTYRGDDRKPYWGHMWERTDAEIIEKYAPNLLDIQTPTIECAHDEGKSNA